ncbi:carbamoyltransferase HypF [Synechococcus sp. Tobar12-5m-g]|uniref:carbamoyltransferase HypF n=1 Tax=unclassified Synechococcus TaxID=2626047 RepID=UPI0020CE7928|nr:MULTISPECIES: carbamoyltransferase HypF [unclassified Synechococcus]MCP9771510.1 carbamoyltransferase HypF [Synechococcus sp. Tobar12-5m-g]MCP9872450.1 carbamoyltransferase HypF [Synechococcus sp. Cruz CV-v-12]
MSSAPRQRLRLRIEGLVQGVGFRPFVHRLASSLELAGWVENTPAGVCLELEGTPAALDAFLERLPCERPPHSRLDRLEQQWLPPQANGRAGGFRIRPSAAPPASSSPPASPTALVLPDLAPCEACLAELSDLASRRCGYAFTSCAHCGPRFSILRALPFERRHTSLASFPLCAACAAEYADPTNRRFHAQTTGCPACGPRLSWSTPRGPRLRDPARANGPLSPCLASAAAALRAGRIVALQGVGGFQLLCLAGSEAAVAELRRRKGRPEKPFALLAPDLPWVRRHCRLGAEEESLLTAPTAPIVLLRRRPLELIGPDTEAGATGVARGIAVGIAPHNPWLGVMLAASPLHALLVQELGVPLVATSGNRSGEPLCADAERVEENLGALADGFLSHDRPIANPVDDGIVQLAGGVPMVLRHARGQAPTALDLSPLLPHPDALVGVVAMGGHVKGSLAIGAPGGRAWLGPHLGDLDSLAAEARLRRSLSGALERLGVHPRLYVVDGHPAYASHRIGAELAAAAGVPLLAVQHHQAHLLACLAEHGLRPPAVGVAWDGAGQGSGGTLWGGECLRLEEPGGPAVAEFTRLASLRPFPLPGAERAMREPRRAALGLLFAGFGPGALDGGARLLPPLAAFTADERRVLRRLLQQEVQAPQCSSVGRLFDAIASLLGLAQRCSFEGQAALRLEAAAMAALAGVPVRLAPAAGAGYTLAICPQGSGEPWLLDWQPLLEALLHDLSAGRPVEAIALAFHQALAQLLPALAGQLGAKRLLLTGGCFQNRLLLELAVECLGQAGIEAVWPQRIPCNDGGLALGQLLAAGSGGRVG